MEQKNITQKQVLKNINNIAKTISTYANINLKNFKILKYDQNICLCLNDSKQKYFAKIFLDHNIETEIFWLTKLKSNDLCVPYIHSYNYSTKKIPYDFIILEYCNYELNIHEMSDEYKYIIAKIIGQNITKLHKIKVEGFGRKINNKWTNKTWLSVLKNHSDITNEKIATKLFTKEEIIKIINITKDQKMNIKNPALIHGDTNPNNFLYTNKYNKQITLIDPGSIIAGDPMFDLAHAAIPKESYFYKGLKSGYEIKNPLTSKENYRLDRLKIICAISATIGLSKTNKDCTQLIKCAKELLQKI